MISWMKDESLNEREQRVLEAVVRTYVDTAEPAGSRTVARRFGLGISPATIRNTMSDLEEKGYLYHPHTSAGRMPTDRGYRLYVDALLTQQRPAATTEEVRSELRAAERSGVELLLRRAAQVLGLLTSELGMAIGPGLSEAILDRIELLPIAEGKVLLVLELRARGPRTVFVDVPAHVPPGALVAVAQVLNERLCGHSLIEVRATLAERLRDAAPGGDRNASELLNVFIQSADGWLDPASGANLLLGRASVLADQPEFQSGERLKGLLELTERTDLLTSTLSSRVGTTGLTITIGAEHADPALAGFTIITSEYRVGDLRGVIGVMGPTRMPYERIIGLVEGTSSLVSEYLT